MELQNECSARPIACALQQRLFCRRDVVIADIELRQCLIILVDDKCKQRQLNQWLDGHEPVPKRPRNTTHLLTLMALAIYLAPSALSEFFTRSSDVNALLPEGNQVGILGDIR
jgi:hypothetical protein